MITAGTTDRTGSPKSPVPEHAISSMGSAGLGLVARTRSCGATDLSLSAGHVCLRVTLIASQMT